MGVTVLVGTFGDAQWIEVAQRAIASARPQATEVIHVHGATLAQARNRALERANTEYVIHLDADDELAPGYVDALLAGSADLRVPSVQYVRPDGRAQAPYVPRVPGHRHACAGECLPEGNYIVVGALVKAELVRQAGGWWEEGLYEDWSLWARVWKHGASVETIPEAVYVAHARPDSRNRAPGRAERERWHREIHRSVFA